MKRVALLSLLVLATTVLAQSDSPEVVVRKYLQGDADGKLTSSEGFQAMSPLFDWPDAPGWDTFTVISDYALAKPHIVGKRATVLVTYTVLGELDSTPRFRPDDYRGKKVQYLFVLRRKAWRWENAGNGDAKRVKNPPQWRIIQPQLQPHISLGTAKKIATDWRDHPFDADSKSKAEEVLTQLNQLHSL